MRQQSTKDKIAQHRAKRDELNKKVQAAKGNRDHWNRTLNNNANDLMDKKRQKVPNKSEEILRLKKEIKLLEIEQATTVLTLQQENKIIRKISTNHNMIADLTDTIQSDDEISLLIKKVKNAREKAQYYHNLAQKLVEKAQQEHNAMITIQGGK